eukprot:6204900-Pleurochrysis_carterae.AAC.5
MLSSYGLCSRGLPCARNALACVCAYACAQSIYGWRGASQENTARIGDDFDLCAKSVRVPPAPVPAAAVESEQAMAAYIARLTDDEPGDGHLGVRLRLELNYRSRQARSRPPSELVGSGRAFG